MKVTTHSPISFLSLAAISDAELMARANPASLNRLGDVTVKGLTMPAYLIAAHKIIDSSKFESARAQAASLIDKFGGRYLTKPGTHRVLGNAAWKPDRVVIIEFPDMETLDAFYASPEYQPVLQLRHESTVDLMIAVE